MWFRARAAWNQQQVFPWAWREIMCNAAGLNHWELWSKRTCFNSANGESGENVWINLVCFELNPCRINPSYETTHVLSRILPMRIKSPLRNGLHVRYLAFLKAECICYFDQWVSRLLWRERKQDAPWCSLFCGTQIAIFERGLGQSSSKMPKKHNCDYFFDGTKIFLENENIMTHNTWFENSSVE